MLDEKSSRQQEKAAPGNVSLVLQELRQATAVNHRGLERRLPFTSFELDLNAYTQLIKAYYGFYVPLEKVLDRFEWGAVTSSDRHKASALESDLLALGMTAGEVQALAQCPDLPDIQTHAQLMGALYVVEGATLGGQILRRIARDKLGIHEGTGGKFLDVYGSDTGRMWKAYLEQLAQVAAPAERHQVVSSALGIFVCFERWLEHSGVLLLKADCPVI
ncbi:biliverdin-producing heme oxygenase [Pseudomonas caspiana]